MFLGFNSADFSASKTRLGFPDTVRVFPTPANFDSTVDVDARVAMLRQVVEDYNKQGISVFFSEKPNPAAVIVGALDAYYVALAFMLRGLGEVYGLTNFYAAWHEPENDVKTTAHPNNPIDSPEQFADMSDHIYHMMHLVEATHFEVGVVFMAYQWEDATKGEYKVLNPAAWIPAKRDFVGADVYSDLYQKLKTKLSDHTGWKKILLNAGDSPVFIVERGIKDHAQQATSLIADFQYLATLDNYVIGMLYWDNTGDAGDWRLAPDAAAVWKDYNYML